MGMTRVLFPLLLCGLTASALAQEEPADVERARELFGEGVSHSEAARYQEAAEAFRAVLAIRSAPAVRYNLALSLFELGSYPEADAQIQAVLDDSESPTDLRMSARELRDHIDDNGGRIQIELAGATEGASVKVDGYTVEDLHRPIRVVAGASHQVAVVMGEDAVVTEDVQVAQGESRQVRLVVAPSAAEAALGADASAVGGKRLYEDWRFWAAAGTVVLIAVVVVVAAIVSGSDDPSTGSSTRPLTIHWP